MSWNITSRVLLVILVLAVALGTASLTLGKAPDASMSLVPSHVEANPGDVFMINVSVNSTVPVYAAQYTVLFNPQVLDVVNQTQGPFLTSDGNGSTILNNSFDNADGYATYGEMRQGDVGGITGNGTLATIWFRVKDSAPIGSTAIVFKPDETILSDTNASSIDTVLYNCTVNVGGASVEVFIRVESNTTTLFNGTITVPPNCTVVDTNGTSHFIDHPTALGALVEAANRSGFTYNISSYPSGLYITDINGDSWVQYRVNYVSPWDSVDQYNLTGGEYVLFATGQYYPFYPLKLDAPSSTRSPFNVSVLYYNDTVSTWLPLSGATVLVDGTPAGTTDAHGNLLLSLPGRMHDLRAEKEGYIRSEKVKVNVLLPPALVYTIEDGGSKEIIQFIDHTSSPAEGNWTVLSGGRTIPSPTLLFRYNVTSTHKSYTVGSKNITIESSKRLDEVAYPFTTYQLYLQNDTVNAAFYGASGFAGDSVSFWLARADLDDVRDIDRGLRNGDAQPLRQLLNGAERQNATLNSGGDASASFSSVPAGSYVLFVTNLLVNPLTDPFIQIYSLTPVEVLKYDATVSAQSPIGLGASELPVTISIGDSATQGAQYRYGALLIKDSAYRYIVDLTSDTSAANTNVDVNGERVIAGWDLIDINAANAQNVLRNTTGPNNGSVSINDLTTSTSSTVYLDTSTLGPGTYRLISAVYEKGNGIVALDVRNIIILRPSAAGGGAGARPDIYGTPAPTPTPISTPTATPVVTPVIQPVEESKVLSSVSPEAPAVVEFTQTEVTKIELDVNTPAENVEVVVEQSAEPPAGVPDVVLSIAATQPELASRMGVYGYISIDTTLPEGTVDKAKVEFKVPKSWFVDNGLDPATTALQHYNEASGQWEALPTDQTGEDDEYYYFSAETPGFSVFSVVAQRAVVATPTPTPTPTKTGIPGFEAILAIGALLAIVYLVGRRTR